MYQPWDIIVLWEMGKYKGHCMGHLKKISDRQQRMAELQGMVCVHQTGLPSLDSGEESSHKVPMKVRSQEIN